MRVVVMGATGTVGRHVVDALLAEGVRVRAVTRRPEAAVFPAGVEVVGGDWADAATLPPVFAGADRAYLLATAQPVPVVEAAAQAGVRGIVTLSSASAGSGLPGGEFHRAAEAAVEASGLRWTHLRPGMFTANLLDWAASVRADGVVREPYAAARHAPVHERDIAEIAAQALLSDDHSGRIYPLSGPESLTKPEQLAAIGRGIGRDVRFEEIPVRRWRAEIGQTLPAEIADFLLALWAIAAEEPDPVLPTVREVLGRPARTVTEWAVDHAEEFR